MSPSIAVLSNVNMEPLKKYLPGVASDAIYFSGYNQYVTEFLNPDALLHQRSFDVLLLHLDAEELLRNARPGDGESEVLAPLFEALDAADKYLENSKGGCLVISLLSTPPFSTKTFLSRPDIEERGNACIREFCAKHFNAFHLDLRRLVNLEGYRRFYDQKFWYLGRIKYSAMGFSSIGLELVSIFAAYTGKTKKVLILDLDETIWGGIVGEDGLGGLRLSEDGEGKAFRDFQRSIKSLKEVGVLLAICSKNNEADAKEIFEKHPMMILEWDDFTVRKINWKNKAQNIREIAEELELGLDSFVFLDDNPVEREIVAELLPEVAVPAFPKDISELAFWFQSEVCYGHFPRLRLTDEDKEKTEQYRRNVQRKSLQRELTVADYIRSLDISLAMHKDERSMRPRLAQLTQKTNQFNMTTKRYTDEDLEACLADPKAAVYALEYKDKFGNEGVIGECIVRLRGEAAEIDTFLLSCRVIGRGVEFDFLGRIIADLNKAGVSILRASFVPTKKNAIAKDFYRLCGFVEQSENSFEASAETVADQLNKTIEQKG